MKLHYDEETERFRSEFLAWVEEHLPPEGDRAERRRSSAYIPAWGRVWQRQMFDDGWLVPGWPPAWGGRNANPVQQLVYFEEVARRQIPRAFNPQGMSIIAPSLRDVGTEEQKDRYALPCLRGEITFCLGMSEPEAGSDLASLRTRAVLDGDHFVVNGQKVWTSGAPDADFCFCFVRTDPEAPKHQGISVLIIDMATPGISVRPLPELTDPAHADFSEVFFSDVVVPRENLVGELNRGWSIAGGSLAHERGMLWTGHSTRLERDIETLRRAAMETGVADDPIFRSHFARIFAESQALKCMGYRGFSKFAKGLESPEQSVLKLYASELMQRLYLETTEALGPLAVDFAEAPLVDVIDGQRPWPIAYLASFSNTIAGGTSEVQRNIIAERVLGLPRR